MWFMLKKYSSLFQYPRLKPPALAGQLSATTLQADSGASLNGN
jgi:hypothetical protein